MLPILKVKWIATLIARIGKYCPEHETDGKTGDNFLIFFAFDKIFKKYPCISASAKMCLELNI